MHINCCLECLQVTIWILYKLKVLVFKKSNLHYYAIIAIQVENGLKATILSFITMISGTIRRPEKICSLAFLSGFFDLFSFLFLP